jgi:serine protease Do
MVMKKNSICKVLFFSILMVAFTLSWAQPSTSDSPSPVSLQYVDLTAAAELSIHAVVHIKTEFLRKNAVWDDFFGEGFMEQFFGITPSQYPIVATGSGVIIDKDGYIVTNNHVVQDASKITVTLNNKREYNAQIVATDPQTDLALIKIEGEDFPFLVFGNSDDVKIGEWVLAVGNPFNLTSTVTAGIVSAKARNLNILGNNATVESFIQTDAAVNKGNSGGALVNIKGELIGINSAIASGTGFYTGYSFAIPSNIAKKVVNDLKKYNSVQRAKFGASLMEIDSQKADELNLKEVKGLYVTELVDDGAASQGGLVVGDIILNIDNTEINSMSEMREILTRHSPGDEIAVTYLRDNSQKKTKIELK